MKSRLGQGRDVDTAGLKGAADSSGVQIIDRQGNGPSGVGLKMPQPWILLQVHGSYDQEHLQSGYQPGLLEKLGDGIEGLRDPARVGADRIQLIHKQDRRRPVSDPVKQDHWRLGQVAVLPQRLGRARSCVQGIHAQRRSVPSLLHELAHRFRCHGGLAGPRTAMHYDDLMFPSRSEVLYELSHMRLLDETDRWLSVICPSLLTLDRSVQGRERARISGQKPSWMARRRQVSPDLRGGQDFLQVLGEPASQTVDSG